MYHGLSRPDHKIDNLRREAASCQACPLWEDATQTVFGEGPSNAEIMLVGEQPGDREDREGRPFVGPAGQLLTGLWLRPAWIAKRVYVTNAVKHFKFEPRGKRRLQSVPTRAKSRYASDGCLTKSSHPSPTYSRPRSDGCAESAGRAIPVQSNRGEILECDNGLAVFVTIHPSALLRLQDEKKNALATRVSSTTCARLSA